MKTVKIIASTFDTNSEKRAMIGGVYEVRTEAHRDNTVAVWDKNKTTHYWFNLSDVQEVVLDKDDKPVYINNEVVCVGDYAGGKEIFDWYIYDNQVKFLCGSKESTLTTNVDMFVMGNQNHTPKHPTKTQETIQIGELTYNKKEIEDALQNIKPIK